MNVQASKSSRWNQSPNTSKTASSRSSGVDPRRLASETMRSTVHTWSRTAKKARTSASLEGK